MKRNEWVVDDFIHDSELLRKDDAWRWPVYRYKRPAMTTDIVCLFEEKEVLLIKRNIEPYKDCWCLPGGHVDCGETIKQAAIRELHEEVGINIPTRILKLVDVYSELERDPRGWTITTAFVVNYTATRPKTFTLDVNEVKDIKWQDVSNLNLGFDHNEIVRDALNKIR